MPKLTNSKSLRFDAGEHTVDNYRPRIGGPALIGGHHAWPVAPDGSNLLLVASIPSKFVSAHTTLNIPAECFVSVFSYFSPDDYFLDNVTYHGDPSELASILSGFTKVMIHLPGTAVFSTHTIPAMAMNVAEVEEDPDCICYTGSKIGGAPGYLQQEPLDIAGFDYLLQLYGGDFPKPFRGVFGLSDAVGYVFLPQSPNTSTTNEGLFFAQCT